MKISVWVLSTCIPSENRPCLPEVFATEAEARNGFKDRLREEWEYNGPELDESEWTPDAAKMPDGTVVHEWDERLRAAGATPLYLGGAGCRQPFPEQEEPEAINRAIAEAVNDEWGEWELTSHNIEINVPEINQAVVALRAVKAWHAAAPIGEIEAVEQAIGENFPQALVEEALRGPANADQAKDPSQSAHGNGLASKQKERIA